MIFNSVSLENFGIVKSFSKEFDKNILVLAGENGHGKSTILKAILLAVFDDYEGVLSDYVNWDSEYFQVIVKFMHRGVNYESIVRYEGSTDRTLRFENKVLKGDEAKKKLKEIIDVDLLKAGMLAMEQKIAIVETKPAERREYLKRIYDIEFKRQLSDLENDIKASEIELAKKVTIQNEIENKAYTIPEKPSYPFDKTEYELIKANLEIERNKLHVAEQNAQTAQQMQVELGTLDGYVNKFTEDIKKLVSKIKANAEAKQKLPEEKDKRLESETDFLTSVTSELAQSEHGFTKKIKDLTEELGAIVLERLPAFNIDDFNSISQELYTNKKKLEELHSAKDVCPTCGQNISSPEHIAKRKEEILILEQEVDLWITKFTEVSCQKSRRETADKTNLEKTNRKTELKHQIDILTEKCDSERIRIQASIDQIKTRLDRIDADFLAENNRLNDLIAADSDNKVNLQNQYDLTSLRITEIRERLSKIEIVPLTDIKSTIQRFESDIRNFDDIVSRISEIERMEQQVAIQKENDLKQINIIKTEIQVLNQLVGDWKVGIKILKTEFPVYVISRVIKDIEKSMNEFLKRTYPKYNVEVQDKKNALHVVYGPKKRDISSASGFERQIFSLSFMYAISHAIGNKCLLLDECDSAATEKNSGVFYRVLGDAIGQGIDQIILISHKPTTRSVLEFDYGAEVVMFENGVAS